MTPRPSNTSDALSEAGSDLRQRVESLGSRLAGSLGLVLSQLPRRAVGPQMLGTMVGTTTVTASRLLKALGQQDPVAVLQLLPGPNPLGQILDGAAEAGVPAATCEAAREAVGEFDQLIRSEAGDRSALKAMLSAWLPEERKEFETQRRQAIHKAMTELEGVSCEFGLTSMILSPSASDAKKLDVITVEARLGIDRIRPDAVVKLGTRRLLSKQGEAEQSDDGAPAGEPRRPLNLDGDPVTDGFHTARLDDFCDAPPAPLVGDLYGEHVQYSLGPTGFGPSSTVDLIVGEVNRAEISNVMPKEKGFHPYFFTIPDMPNRRRVMDLLVHEDVYPGCEPELLVYDVSARGPARADDPERKLDLRPMAEEIEKVGSGTQRLRLVEFPRYCELQEWVFGKLGLDPMQFRCYRLKVAYPMIGRQLTMVFRPPGD